MRTIQVSDEVYERFERKAEESGVDVQTYVAGMAGDSDDDVRRLFTPERIAEIERIAKEMDDEGGSLSLEESWAEFQAHRDARMRSRAE